MELQRGNPLGGGCGMSAETGSFKVFQSKGVAVLNEKKALGSDTYTVKFDKDKNPTGMNVKSYDQGGNQVSSFNYNADGKAEKGADGKAKCADDPCSVHSTLPDHEAKQKMEDAKKAAEEDAKKKAAPAGASSCANPDSCSSSCSGANEQATFGGNCMSSEAAAAHPEFGGAPQGADRAGPQVNPGAGGDDRNRAPRDPNAASQCRARGGSGSDNTCAHVMCGENSNMAANTGAANIGGMAVEIRVGGGRGGGEAGGGVDSSPISPARAQAGLNTLACCGVASAQLSRAITLNRGCQEMRCADSENGGDCSCVSSPTPPPGRGGVGGGEPEGPAARAAARR